jgi:xanthine dehydrogenase iron-sulfur cluster and FAD-binding subunit A
MIKSFCFTLKKYFNYDLYFDYKIGEFVHVVNLPIFIKKMIYRIVHISKQSV